MAKIIRLFLRKLPVAVMTVMLSPAVGASAQQAVQEADIPPGLRLFLSTGCGACHRIAGTEAQGKIGPDLTHITSRRSIGANILKMNPENLNVWIRRTQELKPGARMPSFGMLPESETNAIVEYLMSLK